MRIQEVFALSRGDRPMLPTLTGWLLCVALIAVVGAWVFIKYGASEALGIAVVLSFAFPVWLTVSIGGIPVGIRTFVGLAALIAFAIRSPWKILSPLTLLDVLVIGMVVLHMVSDMYYGASAIGVWCQAYGEWGIPYAAGRYAMRTNRSLIPLAWCVSGVVLLLGMGGLLEMFTGSNPWEMVFGNRPIQGFSRDAARFGFKRAFGTTLHPIFFGLLVLALIPWPTSLIAWMRQGAGRSGALGIFLCGLGGVFSSLSRGPLLVIPLFLAAVGAIWKRWVRIAILAIGVLFVGWIVADINGVMRVFEILANEDRSESDFTLDGEVLPKNSVAQRYVQWKVWWPALAESGYIGYGTKATTGFPPDVPYKLADEKARKQFKYVDNAYILIGLRFGWTGVVLFSLLFLAAMLTGFRLSWDRSVGPLGAGIASMAFAMLAALWTVWFSYDMGFEVLWSFGVLGGLASEHRLTSSGRS